MIQKGLQICQVALEQQKQDSKYREIVLGMTATTQRATYRLSERSCIKPVFSHFFMESLYVVCILRFFLAVRTLGEKKPQEKGLLRLLRRHRNVAKKKNGIGHYFAPIFDTESPNFRSAGVCAGKKVALLNRFFHPADTDELILPAWG